MLHDTFLEGLGVFLEKLSLSFSLRRCRTSLELNILQKSFLWIHRNEKTFVVTLETIFCGVWRYWFAYFLVATVVNMFVFWYIYIFAILCGYENIYIYIYIYVWKLNQTVLELDFRAVKFLFFPRRDLNPHHCYTAAPFA